MNNFFFFLRPARGGSFLPCVLSFFLIYFSILFAIFYFCFGAMIALALRQGGTREPEVPENFSEFEPVWPISRAVREK